MKKYKLKRYNVLLFTFIILMFLELSFRILTGLKIGNISFLYVFLYNIFVSLLISFIVTWGNKVFNKVLYYVSIFLISFIYALQLCVYKMFGFYFDWSLLGATDQVASFAGDGLKLVLAGGIDHKSAYASEIKEKAAKHHVIMPGYVDGEPLRQLYSHARLFVIPSYNEGFPLVLLEAMSYHLPILASDIKANKLPELPMQSFFKTGDTQDLSRHIRQELSLEPRKVDYAISNYTWTNVASKVAEVFDAII